MGSFDLEWGKDAIVIGKWEVLRISTWKMKKKSLTMGQCEASPLGSN